MNPGDVISYLDMCKQEGVNLQRGMNFRLKGNSSVILMSVRRGAPYADRVEDGGSVLIYEGHDVPKNSRHPRPKAIAQPLYNPNGSLTQNGLFFKAAEDYKKKDKKSEQVKVYEKIKAGIWVYNGIFELVDAWQEKSDTRKVFKFKLHLNETQTVATDQRDLDHSRLIPTPVKLEVWKRDKGKCVECGSADNLHFDHIIPFSRGGSSLVAANIQLLCVRHNLAKHDQIQ